MCLRQAVEKVMCGWIWLKAARILLKILRRSDNISIIEKTPLTLDILAKLHDQFFRSTATYCPNATFGFEGEKVNGIFD
jgi:hypothetical protein